MDRSILIAGGVVLACLCVDAAALSRRAGEPGNHGIRRYVAGEVAGGVRIGQTFLVRADGLSSIAFRPRPLGTEPATAPVVLELYEVRSDVEVVSVQRAAVPLDRLTASDTYTWRFPPLRSARRFYRFEVVPPGRDDQQTIGLLATRGLGYRHGGLLINGRERWGDLVFETSVDGARSSFVALQARMAASGVPAPTVAIVLLIATKNAALFFGIIAVTGRSAHTRPLRPAHR